MSPLDKLKTAAYSGGSGVLIFIAYSLHDVSSSIDRMSEKVGEANQVLAVLVDRDERRSKDFEKLEREVERLKKR